MDLLGSLGIDGTIGEEVVHAIGHVIWLGKAIRRHAIDEGAKREWALLTEERLGFAGFQLRRNLVFLLAQCELVVSL